MQKYTFNTSFIINGTTFFIGNSPNGTALGYSVSSAGDLNGDGLGDIVVGAPGNIAGNGPGEGYVIFGGENLPMYIDPTRDYVDPSRENNLDLYDDNYYSSVGSSVASVGDINKDGLDDIIIGAPSYTSTSRYITGSAYVVFGAYNFDYSLSLTALNGTSGFIINGQSTSTSDGFGSTVSSAGDINGDGFQDMLISAPHSGNAYVVFGKYNFTSPLNVADLDGSNGFLIQGGQFGKAIASIGDINKDGFGDIALGSPAPSEVHIMFGQSVFDSVVSSFAADTGMEYPPHTFSIFSNGGQLGAALSSAGDVNGDGFNDIVIGDPDSSPQNEQEAGNVYVVFGSNTTARLYVGDLNGTNGFSINGSSSFHNLGRYVSPAGDINKDGFDDIAVSAQSNGYGGEVWLVPGGSNFNESYSIYDIGTLVAHRSGDNSFFGSSMALLYNISGDNKSSLILGNPGESCGQVQDCGRAYVGSIINSTASTSPTFQTTEPSSISSDVTSSTNPTETSVHSTNPAQNTATTSAIITNSATSSNQISTTLLPQGLNELILGNNTNVGFGNALSSADVNGDGIPDLLVGNTEGGPGGAVYVVYGNTTLTSNFDIYAMNQSQGFTVYGGYATASYAGEAGKSVSTVKDFNGDGIEDFIVGTVFSSNFPGGAYIILGQRSLRNDIYLSNQEDGFITMIGASKGDNTGNSVSYADMNGDGFTDAVIGAPYADLVYVVFGHEGMQRQLNLSNLSVNNGFIIRGEAGSQTGSSVSYAGDINKDGLDDIIIGAPYHYNPNSSYFTGSAYVVFGDYQFDYSLNLSALNGTKGFIINAWSSYSVSDFGGAVSSAGDFNGDGFGDVMIGAYSSSPDAQAYVVFGTDNPQNINIGDLNGNNGFVIIGPNEFGYSVSSAGDFNGDGFDDVMIGDPQANFDVHIFGGTGAFYVVYGKSEFDPVFNISNLDRETGFSITGQNHGGGLGESLTYVKNFAGHCGVALVGGAIGTQQIFNSAHVYLIENLTHSECDSAYGTTNSPIYPPLQTTESSSSHSDITKSPIHTHSDNSSAPNNAASGQASSAAAIGGVVGAVAVLSAIGVAWYMNRGSSDYSSVSNGLEMEDFTSTGDNVYPAGDTTPVDSAV